jgi:penicillin-binding protein 1C
MYPPDIAHYLRLKGQYVERIAAHYDQCKAYRSEQSIKIIYPNMEAKLFLPRDFDGKTQPVVCNVGHTGVGRVIYWYLDNQYLGMTTQEHKMAIVFKEGWNTLTVIDEYGGEDSQRIFAALNK